MEELRRSVQRLEARGREDATTMGQLSDLIVAKDNELSSLVNELAATRKALARAANDLADYKRQLEEAKAMASKWENDAHRLREHLMDIETNRTNEATEHEALSARLRDLQYQLNEAHDEVRCRLYSPGHPQ